MDSRTRELEVAEKKDNFRLCQETKFSVNTKLNPSSWNDSIFCDSVGFPGNICIFNQKSVKILIAGDDSCKLVFKGNVITLVERQRADSSGEGVGRWPSSYSQILSLTRRRRCFRYVLCEQQERFLFPSQAGHVAACLSNWILFKNVSPQKKKKTSFERSVQMDSILLGGNRFFLRTNRRKFPRKIMPPNLFNSHLRTCDKPDSWGETFLCRKISTFPNKYAKFLFTGWKIGW